MLARGWPDLVAAVGGRIWPVDVEVVRGRACLASGEGDLWWAVPPERPGRRFDCVLDYSDSEDGVAEAELLASV